MVFVGNPTALSFPFEDFSSRSGMFTTMKIITKCLLPSRTTYIGNLGYSGNLSFRLEKSFLREFYRNSENIRRNCLFEDFIFGYFTRCHIFSIKVLYKSRLKTFHFNIQMLTFSLRLYTDSILFLADKKMKMLRKNICFIKVYFVLFILPLNSYENAQKIRESSGTFFCFSKLSADTRITKFLSDKSAGISCGYKRNGVNMLKRG